MLFDFAKQKFDIILHAGQSNSEGFGHGETDKPYTPNDKIWMYNCTDNAISMAQERVFENYICGNFSLSFAQKYVDAGLLEDDRKVLIVNINRGSSGFFNHLWGMQDELYLQMMDMTETALSLNPENRIVAFLWHQGETDGKNGMSYDTHYNNLYNLVESVRKKFNCYDVPLIMGNFCYHWAELNSEVTTPVIDAIKAVSAAESMSAFVDTKGLRSNDQVLGNGDTIHFCRDSLIELGIRYFEAYKELIK